MLINNAVYVYLQFKIQKKLIFQFHQSLRLYLIFYQKKRFLQSTETMQKQQIKLKYKYTVVALQQKQHQEKLQKYLSKDNQYLKTSYCRFYLRGNCIMKPQYCKFAHSFEQLKIQQDDRTKIQYFSTQKQRRKKQYIERKDFNQKALFFMKNVDYVVLHSFQFHERYRKRKQREYSLKQIAEERNIRVPIRQVLHRQNWQKLINYLKDTYQNVDFSVSFLSYWFQKVGFAKPQSRCKFGDFMRYMIFVMGFKEVQIVMPPRTNKMLFFVNNQRKQTYLEQILPCLVKQIQAKKQQEKEKQEIILKQLPQNLRKKYICRYYMAGNCTNLAQDCYYAHSIDQLNYEKGQTFPPQYRQPTKSIDFRLNYTQIYLYTQKKGLKYDIEQINSNATLRNDLRRQMHYLIYQNFVKMIMKVWKLQVLPISFLQKQYCNAGFNHTDQNKFQQLSSSLWEIGFHVQEIIDPLTQKKVTNVYQIPELQVLNQSFQKIIKKSIDLQIQKAQSTKQNELVLQSAIRRNIYSSQKQYPIPLHVFLRLKKISLQKLIQEKFPKQSKQIFFQTSEENLKKLLQIVKNYFKGAKKYIHKLDQVQVFVRDHHETSINLNHFINFRLHLQTCILECNKKLYFWPFGSSTIVVDKGCFGQQQKIFAEFNNQLKRIKRQIPLISKQDEFYVKERIVVIDNRQAFVYARKMMKTTMIYGLDLQGRLNKQGVVDLIQFSIKINYKTETEAQEKPLKQIYIFDLFKMLKGQTEKAETQLYKQVRQFLKQILEDQLRIKILHDCRQDSVALFYLLGITMRNVFDTSGMDIYLKQMQIQKEKLKPHQLIRRIHQVKVPGLNNILDEYQAPNGVNIFKDDMKKKFINEKRSYFEQRPIDPSFLEYSAQDVQDLIQVYQVMKQKDVDLLSRYVGQIYSKIDNEKEKQRQVQGQNDDHFSEKQQNQTNDK